MTIQREMKHYRLKLTCVRPPKPPTLRATQCNPLISPNQNGPPETEDDNNENPHRTALIYLLLFWIGDKPKWLASPENDVAEPSSVENFQTLLDPELHHVKNGSPESKNAKMGLRRQKQRHMPTVYEPELLSGRFLTEKNQDRAYQHP